MKIVVFHSGLGNQLFEYMYCQHLRATFPGQQVYAYTPPAERKPGYGLELCRRFDVDFPPSTRWSEAVSQVCLLADKAERHSGISHRFVARDDRRDDHALMHFGYYQDKRYAFGGYPMPAFRPSYPDLGDEAAALLRQMQEGESVAVHVRRGDYLTFHDYYGGICTPAYYDRAIATMQRLTHRPTFYFFSDDPAYVARQYASLADKVVVTCNQGDRSFFDLYLMAHCRHMILANSTFSCWAAYLNPTVGHVICPERWNNLQPAPDLTLDGWISVAP